MQLKKPTFSNCKQWCPLLLALYWTKTSFANYTLVCFLTRPDYGSDNVNACSVAADEGKFAFRRY